MLCQLVVLLYCTGAGAGADSFCRQAVAAAIVAAAAANINDDAAVATALAAVMLVSCGLRLLYCCC